MHLIFALLLFVGDLDQCLDDARRSYAKGELVNARKAMDEAWTLTAPIPQKDPKRYEVVRQFADILIAADDLDGAENYSLQAVNWREQVHGMNHQLVADELTSLAMLIRARKDYTRALVIMQRVQDIHIKAGGLEAPELANDYSRMALIYTEIEQHEAAIMNLELTLRIRQKTLGSWDAGLLAELDRLGVSYVTVRRYEKGEETYRHALLIRERLFGKTAAELIQNVEGLAYAQFGLKKWDDAEINYKRLLALWEVSASKEHPMIAITLDKLALLYREQEKLELAGRTTSQALAMRAHFLANGLTREAVIQIKQGQRKEALVLLKRAQDSLDSKRPEHEKLLGQIQSLVKELAPRSIKKPAAPSRELKL